MLDMISVLFMNRQWGSFRRRIWQNPSLDLQALPPQFSLQDWVLVGRIRKVGVCGGSVCSVGRSTFGGFL